jgi:putative FmdB family regulatory protein
MPVYSFVCPTCGAHFEEKVSFQDNNHLVACPQGHTGVQRVFSTPSIIFKGSGFYVTDHRPKTSKDGES